MRAVGCGTDESVRARYITIMARRLWIRGELCALAKNDWFIGILVFLGIIWVSSGTLESNSHELDTLG